jgi:hypothetical protein
MQAEADRPAPMMRMFCISGTDVRGSKLLSKLTIKIAADRFYNIPGES